MERGRIFLTAAVALLIFGGCTGARVDAPPAGMLIRERMELEAQIAVAKPGVAVCRKLTVGNAEPEWIRGVVVEVASDHVAVRIDKPGRYRQLLNGIALAPGAIVRDAAIDWTPCI
jgi:hypothetical protein